MNHNNLKRKRRSSSSSQDHDYHACWPEKKSRYELSSETETCPSPVPLFDGDLYEEEVVTSEYEAHTPNEPVDILSPRSNYSSEADGRLEASEIDLPSRSSPVNHNGYSSCDERVFNSELDSSLVAGSIIDSDLENDRDDLPEVADHFDELEDCRDPVQTNDDNEEYANCYNAGSNVLTFMGQLTPGSSAGKDRQKLVGCSSWCSPLFASGRKCPVPKLSWAIREEFWEIMCRKDELSMRDRNPDLFEYQPHLKPRMRIILLDWISEVATVFKLHRETFYLTVDYIDRYLSCVPDIPKNQLQLIGVTCLVLASKMEEIYPPKIDQFANVTDGACTEEQIFSMEVTISCSLNWLFSPVTVNNWLEMMLQFMYQTLEKKNQHYLFTPQFSSSLFIKLCHLLDLAILDITSLRFSYCVLAATAIYILVDPDVAISISGLKQEVLDPCVQWLSVYWKVISENTEDLSYDVHDYSNDLTSRQRPELQTHNINIKLYELVQAEFEKIESGENPLDDGSRILTPPPSSSKLSSSYPNDLDDETPYTEWTNSL